MKIDDDIWSAVREDEWKWQPRRDVVGIIWHATRSGQPYDAAMEYISTLNWFRSPNNMVRDDAGRPWYGGMANYVIGGGKVCLAVPEEYAPRYSAGVHDFRAISVEVGQASYSVPYEPRDIELCHELAADLSARYGFKLGRIPFVSENNNEWPGEVGHEDTAQGKSYGKSDPGRLFWEAYAEVDMALLDEVVAALGGIEAIRAWNKDGNSLLVGYAVEQADQDELERKVGIAPHDHPATVPDHTHEGGAVKR
ncbi:MAG: hypothetical protein RLZZ200_2625 [Pseudomonadota bacterium]|jgi:hypothetical protein